MVAKKKAPKERSRGSITSRGAGKYLVRIYMGTDERTGKRLYSSKTVTGTKRDADKELTRMLRESDTNTYVAPTKQRLGTYLNEWLKGKRKITPVTRQGYQRDIDRIVPIIGNIRLEKLTKDDVQHLYDTLGANGISPKTMVRLHGTLRQALKVAIDNGVIHKNPQAGTERPKVQKTEVSILSPAQVDRLLVTTKGTMMGVMWAVALTTGMRPQEYAALKWDDYDGQGLSVQRALVHDVDKKRWVVGPTKNESSRRYVRLPQGTIDILDAYRTQQKREILRGRIKGGNADGWIFPNSLGRHLTVPVIGRRWHRALTAAGLPETRLYDARHAHATHLLLAGKSPKVVSARLGHSTTTITMDIYSHVLDSMEADAADTIDSMIFKQQKIQTA